MIGYADPLYAASLSEFGTPLHLRESGGWLLRRSISGSEYFDGMGCYPLFSCRDWTLLNADFFNIEHDLVCAFLVTDPFGDYHAKDLSVFFPDVARAYKEHFIVNLSLSRDTFVHPHHRRNAHKALQTVSVECHHDASPFLDEWINLYATLIERHNIKGISAFSRKAFAEQFQVPGLILLRAVQDGVALGITLWIVQDGIAYYHLGAYSQQGYQERASFALFWTALELFAEMGLKWLCLGAGAGVQGDLSDGLSRFKSGWATGTRTAYFCGRIFDNERYRAIVQQRQVLVTSYFPAYRQNEFG